MKFELDQLIKGDYERLNFTIYNPDGTIRNIGGEIVHFYAKYHNTDSSSYIHKDSAGTGGVTITSTNPPAETPHGYVAFNPSDFTAITGDTSLICSIKHVDASGNPSSTEFDVTVRVTAGS